MCCSPELRAALPRSPRTPRSSCLHQGAAPFGVRSTHGCPEQGGWAGVSATSTRVPISGTVLSWEGGRNKDKPLQGRNKRVFACPSTDFNEATCRFAHKHPASAKGPKKPKPKMNIYFFLMPDKDFSHQKIHFCFSFKISCLLMKILHFFSFFLTSATKLKKKSSFLAFFRWFCFGAKQSGPFGAVPLATPASRSRSSS